MLQETHKKSRHRHGRGTSRTVQVVKVKSQRLYREAIEDACQMGRMQIKQGSE